MFDKEFEGLLMKDRRRIERLLEAEVRALIRNQGESQDAEQLIQKCANIRAVFKLASALRADTSTAA